MVHAEPDAAGSVAGQPAQRQRLVFEVAVEQDGPRDHEVAGWLHAPGGTEGRPLQVLLHGSTTSHTYWDFEPGSSRYSYVELAAAAGYATLNLDRLGAGRSSRPAAERVTTTSSAFTVAQVVEEVLTGALSHLKFDRVVLVGWSQGAAVAIETARITRVDGLVVTGFMHSQGPDAMEFVQAVWSVAEDDSAHLAGVPGDYLTTRPGRQELFFHRPGAPDWVLDRAERTKDTTTQGEVAGFVEVLMSPETSRSVEVPVLLVMGAHDTLYLSSPEAPELEAECGFWAPEVQLEVRMVPDAGHALTLHHSAPMFADAISEWLDARFNRCSSPARRAGPRWR